MANSDRSPMDGDQQDAVADMIIGDLADNGTMPVLVVDLDGTLIRTDMLAESFWAACSSDVLTPLKLIPKAFHGRAVLKRTLSAKTRIDPVTLPYNQAVIDYIHTWKKRGGRTALVSASDENIVRTIGEHLGIFDEIHGSDGKLNLKGRRKAQFLTERFGEGGYAYMGDNRADIAVWKTATKAITVNAGNALRASAEAACEQTDHIARQSKSFRPVLKAIRPHQWLKNMLVFIPMIAGHRIDATTLLQSGLAFVCFSLIASSVYLLNDLLDLSADRAHPRKHRRPLASGDLSLAHGTLLAPVLLVAGIGLGTILGPPFLLVMAGYYTVTMAYSFFLKRRVLIDIVTLAGLYTIRILAGAAATGIVLSFWLLAFSVFLFFALASVKRQAELVDSASREVLKPSGRGYIIDDLPIVSQMATSSGFVSVLVLALYLNSPAVSALYSQPAALWGLCLILLFWINRMVMVAHRGGMHDDPIVFAVKDRTSLFCGVLGVGCAAAGVLL